MNLTLTALTAVAVLAAAPALAQQDVQYTQFMYDKLTFNPAYAGAKGFPAVSAIARQQWAGFEGAPLSQAISAHGPLIRKRVGLGLRLQNDVIGPTRATSLGLAYAYHVPVGRATFVSVGLDASAMQYRIDWRELYGADEEAGGDRDDAGSRVFGNVGVGALLYADKFYVGLSAPRVLENRLSDLDDGTPTGGKEARHAYLMAGYDLAVGADLSLRPAVNVKYAAGAPLDADLNATLVWRELLGLGVSYRTGGALTESRGESLDGLLSVMPNHRLTLGFAYDYPLTEVGDYTSGSFEVMAGYVLAPRTDNVRNPRYF